MKKILFVIDMHAEFMKKNSSNDKSEEVTEVSSMKEIAGWC